MKKILVTGASGFIGNSLIKELDKRKIDFIGTCKTNNFKNLISVNLSKNTDWSKILKDCDVVIHLAGLAHNIFSEDQFNKINEGSINLIKQSINSNVKKFIFISSIAADKESTDFYGKSKAIIENELIRLSDKSDMNYVIIRPPLVYGANAPGNFQTLKKLIINFPIIPFGSLNNIISIIGIRNLVQFIYFVATNKKSNNNIFLISDKKNISVVDFIKKIAKSIDKKIYLIPVNKNILIFLLKLIGLKHKVEKIVYTKNFDSSETYNFLNWYPSYTTEEELSLLKDSK